MIKQLSIIILTYNSEQLIFDCLDSIYRFNDIGDTLEVIVVDNNSYDQKEVFTSIQEKYPIDLKLINNPVNNGYGGGNNLGIKHSTADYIIVMNPDVRIQNPIFKDLISKFENNKKIGMLGVTFADKSNPFYLKPEHLSLFKLIFFKIYTTFQLYNMNQMYMSGSFLMFDKNIFIQAGEFDENLFLFYEEADISNRILRLGKNVFLAKNIEVYHLTHNRVFNDKLAAIELDSLEYYLKKYNLSFEKIFNTHILIYRIKYLAASILLHPQKKQLFKNWIDLLRTHIVK
ncbi:MAG: glycosyltransferase [Bacteroidales bacterium]|nr:glycosyltransferase [Bacteroidales bacterium]